MTGPSPVVDLTRARSSLERLDEMSTAHPEVRERTAELFAADRDSAALEPLLSDSPEKPPRPTPAARLPADLLARAEDLVGPLSARPDIAGRGRVTRSSVVVLALARGLAALESEIRGGAGPDLRAELDDLRARLDRLEARAGGGHGG